MSGLTLHIRLGAYRAFVVLLFVTVLTALWPSSSVAAKPMSDLRASEIAGQAQTALSALRRAEDLSLPEQRDVVSRWVSSLAELVGQHLEVPSEALERAWLGSSIARQRALFGALSQLGVPYRLNANHPGVAMDCSALTKFAWRSARLDIPRGSTQQYIASRRISQDQVQLGDLAWYPGHVAMSLGFENAIVRAARTGHGVEVHLIDESIINWIRWLDPTQ